MWLDTYLVNSTEPDAKAIAGLRHLIIHLQGKSVSIVVSNKLWPCYDSSPELTEGLPHRAKALQAVAEERIRICHVDQTLLPCIKSSCVMHGEYMSTPRAGSSGSQVLWHNLIVVGKWTSGLLTEQLKFTAAQMSTLLPLSDCATDLAARAGQPLVQHLSCCKCQEHAVMYKHPQCCEATSPSRHLHT